MDNNRSFGAHETFDRDHRVEGSSDRAFGLVVAGFCGLLGAIGWLRHNGHWVWWLLAALVFVGPALVRPRLLAPLNRLWMRFGLLLHAIISPLALFVLFYLCITPVGLLMRLAGKDPLRLRRDPDAKTYWIRRDPPGPLAGSLGNQY